MVLGLRRLLLRAYLMSWLWLPLTGWGSAATWGFWPQAAGLTLTCPHSALISDLCGAPCHGYSFGLVLLTVVPLPISCC